MRRTLHRLLLALGTCLALATGAEPLVGPSVGNADVFLAEGQRLHDLGRYRKAAESFLLATRANPTLPRSYLLLARSQAAAGLWPQACYAYAAYAKAATNDTERVRARGDLAWCNEQLNTDALLHKRRAEDFGQRFIEKEARFAKALNQEKLLLGPGSASETLAALVRDGYLDVGLAQMARQLHDTALSTVEGMYQTSLAGKDVPLEEFRRARALYELVGDTGELPPNAGAHQAFLEGMTEFRAGYLDNAEALFARASELEPSVPEYRIFQARVIDRAGDRARALTLLEKVLPKDPRTGVARVSRALDESPEAGATALEGFLFQRFGKSP